MDAKTTTLTPAAELAQRSPVRIKNESPAYRAARTRLLEQEIELRRLTERVAQQRRELPPGGEVTGDYQFVGPNGKSDFAGLFGTKDTLMIYSMMFGPQRERPCPMCTNLVGPLAANAADLRQKIEVAVVVRSPIERVIAFGQERGWRDLPLFSDVNDNYSRDYGGVLPDGMEIPAMHVFTRRDGTIRHFWGGEMSFDSADPGQDPRGAPELPPLWNVLDFTPAGREASWYPKLEY
jgi:predicted dithiol-disulfide oxidoreductase (DUF899 family)